jgi:hypothetical protein
MTRAASDDSRTRMARVQVVAKNGEDPALFTQLAGFGSPYQSQVLPVPKAIRR